jgi:hypothetical protein
MKGVLVLIILFSVFSCEDKGFVKPIVPDSFSFGFAAGYCSGDCAKFFLIQDGKLYADNMTQYSGYDYGTLAFQASPQPDSIYQAASQLLDNFPQYLMNHLNKSFGCPNCSDQGQFDLTMNIAGNTIYWNIDTIENNVPQEIRSYVERLGSFLQP